MKSKQITLMLLLFALSAALVLALPAAPSIDELSLTSSDPLVNGTLQNLTLETTTSGGDGGGIKEIVHWQIDGKNLTILNVPFEAGLIKDYTGTIGTIINNGVVLESGAGHDGFSVAKFNGTNYLDLGNSSVLGSSDDVTVSLWAKPGSITKNQGLFAVGDDTYNRGKYRTYTILRSGDDARFKIGNSTRARNVRCKDVLADGSDWVHLVGVKEGLTIRIYANGELCREKENIDVDASLINGEQVFIGAMGSKGKRFNGSLDDVMVFNRALGEEQIRNLYERNNQIHYNLTQKGETWRAQVTPVDATQEGTMVADELTIGNTKPTAVDDTGYTMVESTTLHINVLANDYDVDTDTLSLSSAAPTSPVNGNATRINDTHISYTPNAGFIGNDTFTYTINDTSGAQASANVSITVVASDLISPELSQNTPTREVNDRGFEISVKATDNIAIANVSYQMRNASNQTIQSGPMANNGSDFFTSYQRGLAAGIYTLFVTANDTSLEGPNTANLSWELEIIDAAATTFNVSLDSSSAEQTTMQLSFSTTLPASYTLFYGTTQGNLSENVTGESDAFNSTFTVNGLSSATTYFYQLVAKRYDGSQNLTYNGSITTSDSVSSSSAGSTSSSGVSGFVLACSDGVDNDGDGLIDLADGGCDNGNDRSEAGGDNPSTTGNGDGSSEEPQEEESSFSVSGGNADETQQDPQSAGNALTGAVVANQEGSGNGKTGAIIAVVILVLLAGAYFFTKGAKKPKTK